jgi:hypothetical protein
MTEKISKLKYLVVTFLLCFVLIFNYLGPKHLLVGLVFGLAYFLFYSFIFGSIFVAKRGWQPIFGALLLLCLIAIFGAFFIYTYQLNDYVFIFLIILIPAILITPYYVIEIKEKFSLRKILSDYLESYNQRSEPKFNTLLVFAYLFLITGCFAFLLEGQTAESIQAPWQVISRLFIPFYFLATLILLTYVFNSRRTKLPLLLIILHSLLSSSIALIVYKIGYGFDPFIHQATEKIIAQTGTISPKPLYYLGQYAIVVFLNKLTLVDLELIDKILVPFSFALFLPTITFYVFSHWVQKHYALILSILILVLPYPSFIMTDPQNLANLIFVLTILLSLLYYRNIIHPNALYFLALAGIAIHPLAGIPLLITVFLLNLFKFLYHSYVKYISLYFFTSLVFVLFLPLSFIINGSTLSWTSPKLADLKIFGWVDKYDLILNLVYLVQANLSAVVILLIIAGLLYINKSKLLKNNAGYLTAALIIFADFLLIKYCLTFPALRDYDKDSFVQRILILAFYVLLPFFLLGVYWLVRKLWEKDIYTKSFLILVSAGLISTALYLSYPRLNQYEPANFFSVSATDLKAVSYIEQNANLDHIVLANQMVGVSAIKEFSFKKYYDGQFYYSMPMGNKQNFYNYYLAMVYEGAKRETMEKAMAEAGVNESYFVLNQYWNNSEKIANQAAASADEVFSIDNGKIHIFKYQK